MERIFILLVFAGLFVWNFVLDRRLQTERKSGIVLKIDDAKTGKTIQNLYAGSLIIQGSHLYIEKAETHEIEDISIYNKSVKISAGKGTA